MFYYIGFSSKAKKKLHQLKNYKFIILFARSSPAEGNTSYAMKGFLDQFLESDLEWAKYLRDNYAFLIIPMINPDGVSIGNSSCSLSGCNLDYVWDSPDRFIHPEVFYTKRIIQNLMNNNQIELTCELKGHSSEEGCFIYGNTPKKATFAELREIRMFPRMMYDLLNGFVEENCRFKFDASCDCMPFRAFSNQFGISKSYSLFISMKGSNFGAIYSLEDYLQIGADFGKSMSNYLARVNRGSTKITQTYKDHLVFIWENIQIEDINNSFFDCRSEVNNTLHKRICVKSQYTLKNGSDIVKG